MHYSDAWVTQANILCGDNCKCLTCKNYEGSQERRALLDDGVSRLSPTDMKKPRSHEPSPVPPAAAAAVSPLTVQQQCVVSRKCSVRR